MAAQRRKWRESLRGSCDVEKCKKTKITILEDKVYEKKNGKLVLKNNNICSSLKIESGTDKDQLSSEASRADSMLSMQQKNSTSPHQKPQEVENLTPTFRKPEKYLAVTAALMKKISPIQDQENRILHEIHINKMIDKELQNDFSYSDITFDKVGKELSEIENDNFTISLQENNNTWITNQTQETGTTPQEVSPVQCMSFERLDSKDTSEIKCKSPNWATFKACEVEVSIERNSGSDIDNTEDKKLDSDVNIFLESKLAITNQVNIEKGLIGIENIESGDTLMTMKTINGKNEKKLIFADISDEIRPASDSDSATLEYKKQKKMTVRRSKRALNFNKSYLDFVDDDPDSLLLNEAFPSEESSLELNEEETTTSSGDSEQNNSKKDKNKKKKLKKKQIKSKNTIEKVHQLPLEKSKSKTEIKKGNSEKKKKGEPYVNTKGETVEGKYVKPNPCAGASCGNDCGNVSEERRINIFNHFWGLGNYQRRRDWIVHCAIRRSIKRPSNRTASNRSQTYEYYINEGEGRRKICQKFLIATLDITQRFILYTLDTMVDGFAKDDGRGSAGGHNKTSENVIQEAKDFVLDLPLLPSHYCRRDSTKLYLPEEFKNVSNLYRIYQVHCAGKKIMSFKVFTNWFRKTFNIGFHVPKKDKCALCFSSKCFDVKTQAEMEKLQKHETEKEESYKRFIFHQKLNKIDKGTICASFDLQKVLNTPYGESMTLYYSRKIAVYNFTIYESNTKLGVCNLWTEADAKRGANEIATCLLEYIKNVDKRGNVKQIIFYCDSAFGQNKNKTVLAMLRYALSISENVDTIQINYLIPGHTYMPVDSMHATIENSVKNSIVWAPSQWPTIIQFSRKNPEPYTVNVLSGEDFLGFEDIVEHTFKKNQSIQISKISIVTFRKKQLEKMFVKTSMLPDAEFSEVNLSALSNANPKQKLYPSKLPICQKKYTDLKKLVEKMIIPKRFAKEYLDFKTNAKVKDCLPDTDVEDDC